MVEGNEKFWLQKCIEAFRNQDFDSLLIYADEFDKNSDDDDTAAMYRGIACYHKKRFQEAYNIFYSIYMKKLTKEKKRDDNVFYYLALSGMYLGKLKQAIIILTKLEEAYPENIEYRVMLYLAYNLNGEYARSSIVLAEALSIDDKKTVRTLEELLIKATEHSEMSGTAKVLFVELIRKLKRVNDALA